MRDRFNIQQNLKDGNTAEAKVGAAQSVLPQVKFSGLKKRQHSTTGVPAGQLLITNHCIVLRTIQQALQRSIANHAGLTGIQPERVHPPEPPDL